MSDTLIQLKRIHKSFGAQKVISELDLDVYDGEFLTLLGPSGCGKTTILRMIDGFEFPDDGEILLDGEDLVGIPANRRATNTVFQSYALFPHLSVRENVGFGLRMRKVPKAEAAKRVDEALALLQLESLAGRRPSQLSGGQQQRVAIARGLVNQPRVLLLDEPLGALDLHLRRQMQLELRKFQKTLGITFIYVTHDQEEALTMSDRIAVMNGGRIEQIDTPDEIYLRPRTRFAADFLGGANFLEGSLTPAGRGGSFSCEGAVFPLVNISGKPSAFTVRPEFVRLSSTAPEGPSIRGLVKACVFMGQVSRVSVRLPSGRLLHALTEGQSYAENAPVFVSWEPWRLCAVSD